MSINVYDFDMTIYQGDSTVDFHRRCALRCPRVFLDQFASIWWLLGMKLGLVEKTRAKERFYRFLSFLPDPEAEVEAFWAANQHKIYAWYLEQHEADDLVISASPEFLLEPVCARLHVGLIASRVDPHTGKTEGQNCRGAEKAARLLAEHPEAQIRRFYSDSLSDAPLAALAEQAYFVKRGVPRPW